MIIILQDGRLAIGMNSGTIMIYNLKENKNDFAILASTQSIIWLEIIGEKLIALSNDNVVYIFEIKGNEHKVLHFFVPFNTIPYFSSTMSSERMIISTSTEFSVWSMKPPYMEIEKYSNNDEIICIYQVSGEERVVICGRNSLLKNYDLVTKKEIGKLDVLPEMFSYINTIEDRLLFGCLGSIKIIDMKLFVLEKSISIDLFEQFDLVGLNKNTIIIYCIDNIMSVNISESKVKMIKKQAHDLDISMIIRVSDNMFMTSDYGGAIKEWELIE